MKPVISRTFLVQNLLVALAIMLAVVGIIFSAKTVTIIPSPFGSITEGEVQIPLYLGIIPLSSLANFLAFVFIYLMFEFYGFKPAFYTALNQGVAVLMCLVVLYLIANFTLDPEASKYDETLSAFLVYNKKNALIQVLSFVLGNTVTIFFASILKKLMRNYFMFIRFPVAAALGFSVSVALSLYLANFETLAPRSMLLYSAAPALQYLALIIASIVPLYLLRLILGMFRGWSQTEDIVEKTPQSLFKSSESVKIQETKSEITSDGFLPPPPQHD